MAKKDIEVSPYGGSDAAHTVWPLLLPRLLVAAKSTSVLIMQSSIPSPREIQPENRTVSMDNYPLLQCQSSSGSVGKSI